MTFPAANRAAGNVPKLWHGIEGAAATKLPKRLTGMGNEIAAEFRGFDGKILSMYALGLTTRQIRFRNREKRPLGIYGAVSISPARWQVSPRSSSRYRPPASAEYGRRFDRTLYAGIF